MKSIEAANDFDSCMDKVSHQRELPAQQEQPNVEQKQLQQQLEQQPEQQVEHKPEQPFEQQSMQQQPAQPVAIEQPAY